MSIANTGNMRSASIILLFWVRSDAGKNKAPLKRLVGFQQVEELEGGGESTVVELDIYGEWLGYKESSMEGDFVLEGSCM